jgi:peptidase YpeB-like protein
VKLRRTLRRYHIWLGWIVGLPLLAWTVRGEDLLRAAPPLALSAAPVPPAIGPRPVASVALEQRLDGARWVVRYADGGARLADAATGRLLPPVTAADAAATIAARYTGSARVAAVDRTSPDHPPLDLRRKVAAWRVTMSDGTRFYLDAATGEVLARRTSWWRFYDFMWGLHIMDLKTREDTSNPLVIGLGIAALLTTLLALVMLPLTIERRKRRR